MAIGTTLSCLNNTSLVQTIYAQALIREQFAELLKKRRREVACATMPDLDVQQIRLVRLNRLSPMSDQLPQAGSDPIFAPPKF